MPDPGLSLIVGLLGMALVVAALLPERGLLARWRRTRPRSDEVLRQDALKFALQREIDLKPATVDDLAAWLEADAAQTASIVRSLVAAEWVEEADGRIALTALGREKAAQLIRAHRLWERHLAENTGFAETEWHDLADRQEHRLSAAEAEALARRLGHPASDPHGDPIPTAEGELAAPPGVPLRSLEPGMAARVTHIEDEPAAVFDEIAAFGLVPGSTVRLIEAATDFVRIRVNGDEHRLPTRAADNLSVIRIPPEPAAAPPGRPLSSLQPGERGVVLGLSPRCRGSERRRMLDLGILPGTVIEAVLASPGGDPTAYRIRDALIALRQEQAHLIRITTEAE